MDIADTLQDISPVYVQWWSNSNYHIWQCYQHFIASFLQHPGEADWVDLYATTMAIWTTYAETKHNKKHLDIHRYAAIIC